MANLFRLEALHDVEPHLVSDIRRYLPEGLEFKTTTAPGVDPLLRAEVKTFLRVNHTDDDDQIDGYIKSATKKIEGYTHRSMITQTITAYWRMAYSHVFLPRPPHISIGSVTEIDDDGTTTSITSSEYDIFGEDNYVLEFDSSINNQLKIVYDAGYGENASDLPQDLIDAVKWQTKLYYAMDTERASIIVTPNGLVEQAEVLASDYIYNYPG